jgi:fluoride ion exporter CrcB/FEX
VAILPKFTFYSHALDLMVRTGFLGAYTTFSTYSLEYPDPLAQSAKFSQSFFCRC